MAFTDPVAFAKHLQHCPQDITQALNHDVAEKALIHLLENEGESPEALIRLTAHPRWGDAFLDTLYELFVQRDAADRFMAALARSAEAYAREGIYSRRHLIDLLQRYHTDRVMWSIGAGEWAEAWQRLRDAWRGWPTTSPNVSPSGRVFGVPEARLRTLVQRLYGAMCDNRAIRTEPSDTPAIYPENLDLVGVFRQPGRHRRRDLAVALAEHFHARGPRRRARQQ